MKVKAEKQKIYHFEYLDKKNSDSTEKNNISTELFEILR